MSILAKAIKRGYIPSNDKTRGDIYLIQEWLREKHNIDIVIDSFISDEEKLYEGFVYHHLETESTIDTIVGRSYVMVLTYCIIECLKLIK